RLTLEIFHGDEGSIAVPIKIIDRNNIGMRKCLRFFRLPLQRLESTWHSSTFFIKYFNGDERRTVVHFNPHSVLRQVDLPPASRSQYIHNTEAVFNYPPAVRCRRARCRVSARQGNSSRISCSNPRQGFQGR